MTDAGKPKRVIAPDPENSRVNIDGDYIEWSDGLAVGSRNVSVGVTLAPGLQLKAAACTITFSGEGVDLADSLDGPEEKIHLKDEFKAEKGGGYIVLNKDGAESNADGGTLTINSEGLKYECGGTIQIGSEGAPKVEGFGPTDLPKFGSKPLSLALKSFGVCIFKDNPKGFSAKNGTCGVSITDKMIGVESNSRVDEDKTDIGTKGEVQFDGHLSFKCIRGKLMVDAQQKKVDAKVACKEGQGTIVYDGTTMVLRCGKLTVSVTKEGVKVEDPEGPIDLKTEGIEIKPPEFDIQKIVEQLLDGVPKPEIELGFEPPGMSSCCLLV